MISSSEITQDIRRAEMQQYVQVKSNNRNAKNMFFNSTDVQKEVLYIGKKEEYVQIRMKWLSSQTGKKYLKFVEVIRNDYCNILSLR